MPSILRGYSWSVKQSVTQTLNEPSVSDLSVSAEQVFLQEMPGPKELGFDCANGHGEDVSHLFICFLLQVAQDQHHAVLRWQLLQLLTHNGLPGA